MKIAISSIALLDSLGNNLEKNFNKICQGITGQSSSNEVVGFPIDKDLLLAIQDNVILKDFKHVHFWQKAGFSVAKEAIEYSGLDTDEVAIILGSCFQGMMTVPHHLEIINKKGRAHPKFLFDINTHSLGSIINTEYKFKNGCAVVNSSCSTGLYAIEQACNLLQLKKAKAVLVLCIDFACDKMNMHFFESLGAVSKKNKCYPYHADRDGFLPGDGICAMILEPCENLLKRNVRPIAIIDELVTATESNGSFAPDKNGTGIKNILSKIKTENKQKIDFVSSHATGTVIGDFIEYDAVTDEIKSPIIAFKGFIGHTQAAAGLLESAYSIMCMQNNVIPKMPWLESTDSPWLNSYQTKQNLNSFFKLSIGFNGSLTGGVFSKYDL